MAGLISNLLIILLVVTSFKEYKSVEETSSPNEIHPADVPLAKIRDVLIPNAIRSIEDKIPQNQESILKSEVLGQFEGPRNQKIWGNFFLSKSKILKCLKHVPPWFCVRKIIYMPMTGF
jgi:hypothetical protein